jgi:16S rRNA (guanine966-N2)-methyltransferase
MRIIAGQWRGHPIEAPPGRDTRPTADRVREAWMSAMQLDLPGARFLDLFAGSGALGLEALSRGAAHVTFVERGTAALRTLQSNIAKLRADDLEVVRGDAITFADNLTLHAFDIAVADPPYGEGYAEALSNIFVARPFAKVLWIEHRKDDAIAESDARETRRYGDTLLTMYPAPE